MLFDITIFYHKFTILLKFWRQLFGYSYFVNFTALKDVSLDLFAKDQRTHTDTQTHILLDVLFSYCSFKKYYLLFYGVLELPLSDGLLKFMFYWNNPLTYFIFSLECKVLCRDLILYIFNSQNDYYSGWHINICWAIKRCSWEFECRFNILRIYLLSSLVWKIMKIVSSNYFSHVFG